MKRKKGFVEQRLQNQKTKLINVNTSVNNDSSVVNSESLNVKNESTNLSITCIASEKKTRKYSSNFNPS